MYRHNVVRDFSPISSKIITDVLKIYGISCKAIKLRHRFRSYDLDRPLSQALAASLTLSSFNAIS